MLSATISLDVMGVAVVNTALPQIGAEFGMERTVLSWVMTAYAVAFAGLLLLGGRAADVLGRRRMFIAGVALYGLASVAAAVTPTAALLLLARLLQGAGAALSGPAALALIPEVFTDDRERTRAMGVYAAVGATSFAGGLALGGVLTDLAGWRVVFAVLAPIAVLVVAVAPRLLPAATTKARRANLDLPGAVLVSTGLVLLVFGVSQAEHAGVTAPLFVLPVLAGLALLGGFVWHERTAAQPLLPLSLLSGAPVKAATYAGVAFFTSVNGLLFLASLYMQDVLGYSPLTAGLAILPMGIVVTFSAQVAARLLPRTGSRPLLAGGLTLIAAGIGAWLGIGTDSDYYSGLLPGIVVMSVGQGLAFPAMTTAALTGVPTSRHGVASAVNITAQQVGSSLGVTVIASIAAAATTTGLDGQLAGYHAGIIAAGTVGLLGAAAAAIILRRR
ncbi:MFS transporter [Amycolatopsis azurea]|uniref:MFS transporter n=1 Tax=Amycolatopsis azurea TaxID=36819 RepID=UPI0038073218